MSVKRESPVAVCAAVDETTHRLMQVDEISLGKKSRILHEPRNVGELLRKNFTDSSQCLGDAANNPAFCGRHH